MNDLHRPKITRRDDRAALEGAGLGPRAQRSWRAGVLLRGGLIAGLLFAWSALASPRPGQNLPSFRVGDLEGQTHTERDLLGSWSVVIVITDKDSGPAVHAWFERALLGLPSSVRVVSMAALSLFPLIPTSTILSRARSDAPRHRWRSIWVSRDGSLATSLGLEDGEDPWVFVLDPSGRVTEVVHAPVDESGVARLRAALRAAL
ncbi:MAG: hypothetical protein R3A48_15100 [Polyangiales bacterium]